MAAPRLDRLDKSRVINGCLEYWQRGTSFVGPLDNVCTADRFNTSKGGTMAYTILRSTDVPTVTSGFKPQYSFQLDVTTAQASIGATEFTQIRHMIEHNYMRDLIGKNITVSFWVKSPKSGIHWFMLRNGANTHTIGRSFIVDAANTWQKVACQFYLDSGLGYNSGNGLGLYLQWPLAAGSSLLVPGDNIWTAGAINAGPGQQNLVDNVANNFHIALVDLVEGEFDEEKEFSLAGKSLFEELLLCQRYYRKSFALGVAPGTALADGRIQVNSGDTGNSLPGVHWGTNPMRAAPLIVLYNQQTGTAGQVRRYNGATPLAVSGYTSSQTGFHDITATLVNNATYDYHYTAESEF